MKTLQKIGKFFKAIPRLFASENFQHVATEALSIVQWIEFVAPNKTLEQIINVYEHYGLPVTQALADGNLTTDEMKSLLSLAATKALKIKFPSIDTTEANLQINAAYLDVKNGL